MLPITGGPGAARLTPLAVQHLVSAAKAALEGFIGGRGNPPPSA
jgi:hypothetical protein